MVEIEWIAQDDGTLAHASKLVISGLTTLAPHQALQVTGPQRALTTREDDIVRKATGSLSSMTALVVAGEQLGRATLEGVGYDRTITDDLIGRLKTRRMPGRVNLIYPRIPEAYRNAAGQSLPMPDLDDLRLSALVDVQLEAEASIVIPPLPAGLYDRGQFEHAIERTRVSIQSFDSNREMVGYVPTTDRLEVVRDLVIYYVKSGVRFFAVDFSGAAVQPALMRTVVRTIREKLKLKSKAKGADQTYYLHAFNVASSRKSGEGVAPITDLLTHPYGVDSTSGQMWGGGGEPSLDRIRYYETEDYGAYRRKFYTRRNLPCTCGVCRGKTLTELYRGTPQAVYSRTRAHRLAAYSAECGRIVSKLSASKASAGYESYLETKKSAEPEVLSVLADIREIRAGL